MLDRELSDIILSAFDASLDRERWVRTCDLMEARYSGSLFLYAFDLYAEGGGRVWHSESVPWAAQQLLRQYASGPPPEEDAANRRLSKRPAFEFTTELEFFGVSADEALPSFPWRNALKGALGNKSRCGAKLNDIGPWLDVVSLHAPFANKDIPDSLRSEFQFLFPVFGKAIELNRVLDMLRLKYNLVLDLFDRLRFGVAFTTRDGRLILGNRTFHHISGERDAFALQGTDRLAALVEPEDTLANLSEKALGAESKPGDLTIRLRKRSGERPLVVVSGAARTEELGSAPCALMLFIDPEDDTPFSGEGLGKLGVLTPAEIEVCEHLVDGLAPIEISDLRSTSISTTRSQIKSAGAKLGCRTRIDLLRLAMATSAPVHFDQS